ncbi:twin-arginine translocase TatA/TatE family subunit [Rhodopirellula sp. MGV]|uniref:Sec-independent protein translocase subunit TatA/TatB n=1 Tax=Rhodopirellula sp. MGV TaxID=2023130 RepID=UPI000B969308|nr:twin-arginine translocase TatA/TatE family subunit [Rhodopirellula sp. MGV]OYP35056.1 twin-arginine translocase TatA/TatE family subunit [Rhodopirellula sp. MGV]PNY38269.1 twin-arginine translocase TatA/TatE family subunit [Rhodopirellula baltica]
MSVTLSSGLLGLSPLAFAMPGATEMLIFLFVVLLLFGGAKLPSLMRNLGRSANEFKRGMSETADDENASDKDSDK